MKNISKSVSNMSRFFAYAIIAGIGFNLGEDVYQGVSAELREIFAPDDAINYEHYDYYGGYDYYYESHSENKII